jgi:hypothetical protein
MIFEFRTTDGRPCCRTNDPALLCDACRKQHLRAAARVPPPPSLVAAVTGAPAPDAALVTARIATKTYGPPAPLSALEAFGAER